MSAPELPVIETARVVVTAYRDLKAKDLLGADIEAALDSPVSHLESALINGHFAIPQMKAFRDAYLRISGQVILHPKRHRTLVSAAAYLNATLNAAYITAPEALLRIRALEKAIEPISDLAPHISPNIADDAYVNISIQTKLSPEMKADIEKMAGTKVASDNVDLVLSVDGVNAGHLRKIWELSGA